MEDAPAAKKEIACTRSFGRSITELPPLIEAVSEFAMRAGEKLRRQDSLAGQVLTFVHTSPHKPGPQYSRSVTMPLCRPTADGAHLASAAIRGMRAIYRPGYKMAKAGVMLLDLQSADVQQEELDLGDEQPDRSRPSSGWLAAARAAGYKSMRKTARNARLVILSVEGAAIGLLT